MDRHVPCEEQGDGPIKDYITRSEVEDIMEYSIKISVEVATKGIVTAVLDESIGDVFTIVHDELKEGIRTPIRSLVEGTLIAIVEQDRLDSNLVHNKEKVAKSTRLMEALTRRLVENTSFITIIIAFVKK